MRSPAASSTANSTFVITADEGMRGGKPIPLKENTDKAIEIAGQQYVMVKNVLVVRRTGGKIELGDGPRRLVPRGNRGG